MEWIQILGGISLILFGLRFLRKGFARLLGGDLLDWLQGYTRTRFRAFSGGIIAGAVMPSSSAMAFLSVQMTREGKVAWSRVLAVLMGAQVGITVLVQVLTFNLTEYAPVFLAAGGLLFLFVETPRLRGFGQSALAFGFLLLGLGMISGAARAWSGDPAMTNLFEALGALPILFFIGAMLLTVLIQSSTASIAVALGLLASGQVTFPMMILWILGTNVGLCLTVLIAGWSRVEGRRLGVAVLLIKLPLAVVLGIVVLSSAVPQLDFLPGNMNQHAAWTHTLFNLLAGTGLLFAGRIEKLVARMMPDPRADVDRGVTSRLDPLLLQYPALAVKAILRETLRIFDVLHVMRESVINTLNREDFPSGLEASLQERARAVMTLREELVEFLDEISDDDLGAGDRVLKDTVEDLMREMPVMIRILEKELPREARLLMEKHRAGLPEALPVLKEASRRCAQQMEAVAVMLMHQDASRGNDILRRKQENSTWMIAAKREHGNLAYPVWEIIDDFQQLNRRLSGVTYVFCKDLPRAGEL